MIVERHPLDSAVELITIGFHAGVYISRTSLPLIGYRKVYCASCLICGIDSSSYLWHSQHNFPSIEIKIVITSL